MGKTKKGGGKKKYGIVLALLLAFASSAAAQTTPTNPRRIAFTCPDHAADTGHELEIRVRATGASVQTLALGDPAEVTGEVFADINVQPVAFGTYDFVVRAIAGALRSGNSNAVNFDRVPGPPSGSRIVAAVFDLLLRGADPMLSFLGVERRVVRMRGRQ